MRDKRNVYISLSGDKSFDGTIIKEKSKIILLEEEIFIKIIRIEKEDKLDSILENSISTTFRYHDILTHYEKVKINNNNYLILYFIKYYDVLRKIFAKKKNISVTPYEFTRDFKKFSKGLNISIKSFKGNIYLVANINKKIVYTKFFNEDINIEKYIKECIESLQKIFVIDNVNLYIENRLYNDKFIKLVDRIKITKGRVS